MNLKKALCLFAIVFGAVCGLTSCCEPEPDKPSTPKNIEENIIGHWLLASSDAEAWATYEFSQTSRVNVSFFEDSKLSKGSGFYWIDQNKASLTGTYDLEDGNTGYLDWVVTEIQAFEISYKLYDNNQYIGTSAIYCILSTEKVDVNVTSALDFRAICGTNNVSDIRIIDDRIATISETGEVTGLKAGQTYLVFQTDKGHAAVSLEVAPSAKTFDELVVGTWIYDKLAEKEWQRTTFVADGFVDVAWANPYAYNTIETANGYYTLSDNDCSFQVTTPYNMKINQKWVTEAINEFTWTYQAYSDNQSVGKYTGQRLLGTVTLQPGEKFNPEYSELTFDYDITGYSSKNSSVAKVDVSSGVIEAIGYGRTYIDVMTVKGSGVFEVYVRRPAIPYDFAGSLGQNESNVKNILGSDPDYSSDSMIAYFNPASEIDMIGVSFDETTGLAKGVSITFNSTVDVSAVTAELEQTYIPFESQTTITFKAYMDTEQRTDAKIGVTWDIAKLALTYVNLSN